MEIVVVVGWVHEDSFVFLEMLDWDSLVLGSYCMVDYFGGTVLLE